MKTSTKGKRDLVHFSCFLFCFVFFKYCETILKVKEKDNVEQTSASKTTKDIEITFNYIICKISETKKK